MSRQLTKDNAEIEIIELLFSDISLRLKMKCKLDFLSAYQDISLRLKMKCKLDFLF